MEKARLEDVNGTLMLAVPPAILDRLRLAAGSEVEVDTDEQVLFMRPQRRPRRSLADLIAATDPQAFEQTEEDREWLNSPPVGRELI